MHCNLLALAFVLGAVFLSTLSTKAKADVLTTTVVDVLAPEKPGDSWIFLLSSEGRALRVSDQDRPHLEILKAAVGRPQFLEIDFTFSESIDRVNSVRELPQTQALSLQGELPIEPMELTTALTTEDPHLGRIDFKFTGYDLTPQGIFDYFKSFQLRRGSQCFHRAYYWAHQLWRQSGALSHKVFMFFSWNYIRKYNYYWWFHVAPYVYNDQGQEVVIDPTFLKKPVSMREWTNNFLRNDPECPEVTNYSGHSAHGRDSWCYLVKKPMHYYHPNIVEASHKNGTKITKWNKDWLSLARRSR